MGQRLGLGGEPNSGKSWGRRYIPDGENVFIIAPSIKTGYLYTGPANAATLTAEQIEQEIKKGTRTPIGAFDMQSKKFASLLMAREQLAVKQGIATGEPVGEVFLLDYWNKKMKPGSFKPEHLIGNIAFCERVEDLQVYLNFVNLHLPWIHTIIFPDFTHYLTSTITSDDFRNKTHGNDQYKKYLDLAADSLKNFILSSHTTRKELIIVTEFHVEVNEKTNRTELFVPGGKMLKEKFLPSSYYDTFLFTDVEYSEHPSEPNKYYYVTRSTAKYPEARSGELFDQTRVPNNLQEVLSRYREAKALPIPKRA